MTKIYIATSKGDAYNVIVRCCYWKTFSKYHGELKTGLLWIASYGLMVPLKTSLQMFNQSRCRTKVVGLGLFLKYREDQVQWCFQQCHTFLHLWTWITKRPCSLILLIQCWRWPFQWHQCQLHCPHCVQHKNVGDSNLRGYSNSN